MERRLRITESEYRQIMQWEDDGAAPVDVFYDVIPDRLANHDLAITEKSVKHSSVNSRFQSEPDTKSKVA